MTEKVESKRIVFTFDSKTLEDLEKVVSLGKFNTLAEAVRTSISNMARMEEAAAEANSKVAVVKTVEGSSDRTLLQVKL